jgi:hypothetical protein
MGNRPVIYKRRCAYFDHEGPKYLPFSEFYTKRDRRRPGKTYINPYCKQCESTRRRIRTHEAKLKRNGKILLPVEPLADHIRSIMVNGRTLAGIASTIGVDESRVRAILKGVQRSRGKDTPHKTITLEHADEVMVALGGAFSVYECYPELRDTGR